MFGKINIFRTSIKLCSLRCFKRPPNQKSALRIVRYDILTHMEAVCERVGCCEKSIRSHIWLQVFSMWLFMWFCKNMLQKHLIVALICYYYVLLTKLGCIKSFWTKKVKEIRILKHCIMCGKVFKSTNLQSHKRNHTKL